MSKTPLQPQDKFIVRLPDGLRDRIAELAKANGRSMNSEIVQRLQASLEVGDDGACVEIRDGMSPEEFSQFSKEELETFARVLETVKKAIIRP